MSIIRFSAYADERLLPGVTLERNDDRRVVIVHCVATLPAGKPQMVLVNFGRNTALRRPMRFGRLSWSAPEVAARMGRKSLLNRLFGTTELVFGVEYVPA